MEKKPQWQGAPPGSGLEPIPSNPPRRKASDQMAAAALEQAKATHRKLKSPLLPDSVGAGLDPAKPSPFFSSEASSSRQGPSPFFQSEQKKKPPVSSRTPLRKSPFNPFNQSRAPKQPPVVPQYGSTMLTASPGTTARRRDEGSWSTVPLVEMAQVKLETLGTFATWLVYLLPYLALALALWLDTSKLGVRTRTFHPQDGSCTGNVCTFLVDDAPPLNRFLKLESTFSSTPATTKKSADGNSMFTVETMVEVKGRYRGGWSSLYASNGRGQQQVVRCEGQTDGLGLDDDHNVCDTLTLLHLVLDSPGLLKYFKQYEITATLTVLSKSKGDPGEGSTELASGATFVLANESNEYAKLRTGIRMVLAGTTTVILAVWLGYSCKEGKKFWLPERYYLTLLLLALLMWQLPLVGFVEQAEPEKTLLGYDILRHVGSSFMWFSWVALMDGQRFVGPRTQAHEKGRTGSASGQGPRPDAALAYELPNHHPLSSFFLDYIIGKAAYCLLALAVYVAIDCVDYPSFFNKDFDADSLIRLRVFGVVITFHKAYLCLSLAAGIVTLGWVSWYTVATFRTGRLLKGQPVNKTRRQQLYYKLMLLNSMLLVLLMAIGLGSSVIRFIRYLVSHASLESLESSVFGVLGTEVNLTTSWARGQYSSAGQLIYVSCIVYIWALSFLPPSHSPQRRHDRLFINLERDIPPRSIQGKTPPVFCLETALFLCEVAWQAYYDPHETVLDDFVAPGRQDLSYLGVTLVEYIFDEESEIKVIIARGADRLVLAFRGTANATNLVSDLKLAQVPLRRSHARPRRGKGRARSPSPVPLSSCDGSSDGDDDESKELCGLGSCAKAMLQRIPLANQALPRVHMGFSACWQGVRERTLRALRRELEKDYKPLYITGHSLGAALATLAALDVADEFDLADDPVLYTFGSPYVGNRAFSHLHRAKVHNSFRIVNEGDVVSAMPQFLGMYVHAGCPVVVDSESFGTFIVAPTLVERLLGRAQTNLVLQQRNKLGTELMTKRLCFPQICHLLREYRLSLEACMEEQDLHYFLGKQAGAGMPEWLKEKRRKDASSPHRSGGWI
ncbi:unnamed protein product [Chrysoparadoxa australica]